MWARWKETGTPQVRETGKGSHWLYVRKSEEGIHTGKDAGKSKEMRDEPEGKKKKEHWWSRKGRSNVKPVVEEKGRDEKACRQSGWSGEEIVPGEGEKKRRGWGRLQRGNSTEKSGRQRAEYRGETQETEAGRTLREGEKERIEKEGLILNGRVVLKNPKMYVGIKEGKGVCACRKEQLTLDRPGFFFFFYDRTVSEGKQEDPIFSLTQQLSCCCLVSIRGRQSHVDSCSQAAIKTRWIYRRSSFVTGRMKCNPIPAFVSFWSFIGGLFSTVFKSMSGWCQLKQTWEVICT